MYLKEVKLNNWRRFEGDEASIPFKKGLNVLIGENDSGKTAVIDAIRYTLGMNSGFPERIEKEDFSKGTTSLQVECIFGDLSNEEEAFFLEWLTYDDDYNVEELRIVMKANLYTDINGAEKVNRELLAGPVGYEIGFPTIAQNYLRVTYLKPLRDAESELRPGYRSRFAKVIEGLEEFKSKEKQSEIIEKFDAAFQSLEEDLKGPVLDKIDERLQQFLSIDDSRKAEVGKRDMSFQEVLRRLELNYDQMKSGLGSTNILFMSLELLALKENPLGSQITLIEEVEAHLHPQAQLRVIKTFEKYLMEQAEGNKSNVQYILTTHSPILASSISLENLIVLYDNDFYPLNSNYTKLESEEYEFLNRFLDATKANLFFAKGVILVEGYAENILIPAIAEAIGRPLYQYGISIVNVAGTHFNRYLPIFLPKHKELNMPISVITDLDISPKSHVVLKDEERLNEIGLERFKESNTVKKNEKKKYEKWTYITEEIDQVSSIADKKEREKFRDGEEKIKVFLAKPWTLEHSIGKSILREKYEEILLEMNYEKKDGKLRKEKKKEWEAIKDCHKRATATYQFLKDKQLSKAIIAQKLSKKIMKDDNIIAQIKKDKELQFIIQAIAHVTEPIEGGIRNGNDRSDV